MAMRRSHSTTSRFSYSYLVIPLIAALTASLGRWLTAGGMEWYRTLRLPEYTPSGAVIGSVWTVIYILTALSAVLVWNGAPRTPRFTAVFAMFGLNAVLNAAWSLLFFRLHWIGTAGVEAVILGLTVVVLMGMIRPVSRVVALLLAPYALWTVFATWLTFEIYRLN